MRGIKIPLHDFALKMQGGLMREGGAYLRDTMVRTSRISYRLIAMYVYDVTNVYRSVFEQFT